MRCFACGNADVRNVRIELPRQVGRRRYAIPAEVMRCEACGEWTVADRELARTDRLIDADLARRGPLDGGAFCFLRKSLGLRAADLAELLDVTPETISRWENDRIPIERRAAALLGGMVAEQLAGSTATRDRLRAYAAAKPSRRPVRLGDEPVAEAPVRPGPGKVERKVRGKTQAPSTPKPAKAKPRAPAARRASRPEG